MPQKEIHHLHLSTWTFVQFFGIILGLVFFYLIADVVAALFFAVIIASAMEPGIQWLQERKVPRLLGVILIYLGIAIAVATVVYIIFPILLEDVQNIFLSIPILQRELFSETRIRDGIASFFFSSQNIQDLVFSSADYLKKLSGGVVDFASNVFGGVFTFLLIVIFSFYLAIQERGIENFLRLVSPLRHEEYIIDLWYRSQHKLGLWFRSQMLLGAIVGILIFFGLTFLGIPHALLFALIAAVFEIIPVAGPVLAAVPAVAAAFLTSPILGLTTIALYVVVQQIESHVIIPVVMSRTIGLNPLIVMLALVVGAKIGGIFGILIAVPVTAILAEFLLDWNKKKRDLLEKIAS